MADTHYRICPVCEATCGLKLTVEDGKITDIRGDKDDPFSRGYMCPKGVALRDLHEDPDRLRTPLIKEDGKHRPATWEEAWAKIAENVPAIRDAYGPDSIAIYTGNPSAHKLSSMLFGKGVRQAVGTKNAFSASTLDQMPKQLSAGLMFGTWSSIPVPDIDRTDLLVILGGNPLVSNGSIWTVPDFRGRLRELQQRGGKCVVIDPKRTMTAEAADQHHFIRPGTDVFLLAALANHLFAAGLANPGKVAPYTQGLDALRPHLAPFTPEVVADVTGIEADDIKSLAEALANTDRAVLYGRIGTCIQRYGTTASALVDIVNILAGNLDVEGGAMFPKAAIFADNTMPAKGAPSDAPGFGRGIIKGRKHSRVRGAPEVAGEFPAAILTEEIITPGDGQVRALITMAGNPVLSSPDGSALSDALDQLDFMVSVDIYLNETTRHADVILPGTSPLEEGHYDVLLNQFATRNVARYSKPIFPETDVPAEWKTLASLARVLGGQSPDLPADTMSPEEILDMMFGRSAYAGDGLTFEKVAAADHGIDLGPLTPRIPEVLRMPEGKIDLAPAEILADMDDATADLAARRKTAQETGRNALLLIGRRDTRSNNSWMHNLPVLAKGPNRCTLEIHPDDARAHNIGEGGRARVKSALTQDEIELDVAITDKIMPGTISIPHGWGHDAKGANMKKALENPGVNMNRMVSREHVDPLSGTAVMTGVPVSISVA